VDYITGITGGLQPPDQPDDHRRHPTARRLIWAELPADRRVVRWDELEVWVRWLVERYRLGPLIPPCWPAHGWAVEELSALHAAWKGVYRGPGFPDGPAGWMNVLAQFIGRIRTIWADQVCGQYQHEEPGPSWPSDPDTTTVTTDLIAEDQRLREHPDLNRSGRSSTTGPAIVTNKQLSGRER
jgi:hypothetical protein